MTLTKTPIPTGLVINSQIPLDNKLYFLNEASLSNLGELDNFAFIYYKGMVAYCAQEDTSYKWKEIQEAEEGLLNNNFIYPDNWIKEGIDYSNRAYNFVAVTSGTETKISAGTNVTITGNGTDATPYIINSNQDNTVKQIIIDETMLPLNYSVDDVISALLALPPEDRTILDTNSKVNVIVKFLDT